MMSQRPGGFCITGMHRCGTSMVANLLTKCGVDFGSSDELMPANYANILGYFEHQELAYQVNNAILEHFGGSWKNPPVFPENWQNDTALDEIRTKANTIISKFRHSSQWAWKDPRASLLIPFWKSIDDQFKYIICLRNPLDVAQSLLKRDGISLPTGSKLWYQYVDAVFRDTNAQDRVVVFYENFFINPQAELQKLLDFLNIPSQEKHLNLCQFVSDAMRHHHSSVSELERNDEVDENCKALYLKILRTAPVPSGSNLAAAASAEFSSTPGEPEPTGAQPDFNTARQDSGTATLANSPIHFPIFDNPVLSIVIPTFNRVDLLISCIRSVLQFTDVAYELIIVNDASTDETPELLARLINVKILNNITNLDFLRSANLGAGAALGKYLIFLNNDVTVRAGWATTLVNTIERNKRCGAVGVKLVSMNGKLQEAGAIIQPDGAVELYGAGDNPFLPEYSFVRESDYCSAACILVDRKLFQSIGMFDTRYQPAYYEDVDLCMAIWESGHTVIYQPDVTVFHHQMGSRPHADVVKLCEARKPLFWEKWQSVLSAKSGDSGTLYQRHKARHTHLAYIGASLPTDQADTSNGINLDLFKALNNAGYAVSYIPTTEYFSSNAAVKNLQQAGVEVFYGSRFMPDELLAQRAGLYQVICISQQCDMAHYGGLVAQNFPHVKILTEPELVDLSRSGGNNE